MIMGSVCYPACTCMKLKSSNISSTQTGPHKLAPVMAPCSNTHSETSGNKKMCVFSHDHVQCVLPCMYMYEAKIEQYFKYTDRPTQARSCDGDMFQHAFRDLSALETKYFWFSVMIMCSVCYPTCTCMKLKSSNIAGAQTGPHKLAPVMAPCSNTQSETSQQWKHKNVCFE